MIRIKLRLWKQNFRHILEKAEFFTVNLHHGIRAQESFKNTQKIYGFA